MDECPGACHHVIIMSTSCHDQARVGAVEESNCSGTREFMGENTPGASGMAEIGGSLFLRFRPSNCQSWRKNAHETVASAGHHLVYANVHVRTRTHTNTHTHDTHTYIYITTSCSGTLARANMGM